MSDVDETRSMNSQLTGWIDYDRPHLSRLGSTERIDYFERRVHLVAINPLARILENEIHVAPDSSALLIFGVSICCAIEATGKFLKGSQDGNWDRFSGFLNAYMDPRYQSRQIGTESYGQALWKYFRNGLAHGFTVRHGGFERNRGQAYFATQAGPPTATLSVNPFLLYDDYVCGFKRYLADLRMQQPGQPLFLVFDSVFEEVFIQGK